MKVALISALDLSSRLETIRGYNMVFAYHLHRELSKLCDCVLVPQAKMEQAPEVDHAIAISAGAINSLINGTANLPGSDNVVNRSKMIHWLTDGPARGLITKGRSPMDKHFVGMGADPGHCFPEQPEHPVVLLNAWNAPAQRGRLGEDAVFQMQLDVCSRLEAAGVEIVGLNCNPDAPGAPWTGYVPWIDVCAKYRRGWVFYDGTPKVIELGRVEAAACGAWISAADNEFRLSEPGIDHIPQLLWNGDVYSQIMRAIEKWSPVDAQDRHEQVMRFYSWHAVAKRLFDALVRFN